MSVIEMWFHCTEAAGHQDQEQCTLHSRPGSHSLKHFQLSS